MSLLWFYFTFAEYLTGYYGAEPEEMKVFWAKFSGPFWPFFWGMVLCNLFIPLACLVRLGHHTMGKVLTSVAVDYRWDVARAFYYRRTDLVFSSACLSRKLFTIQPGWNWENSPAAWLCSLYFTFCSPKYFRSFPSGRSVRVVKKDSKKLRNGSRSYLPDEVEGTI